MFFQMLDGGSRFATLMIIDEKEVTVIGVLCGIEDSLTVMLSSVCEQLFL
jgi:hypothetical protein